MQTNPFKKGDRVTATVGGVRKRRRTGVVVQPSQGFMGQFMLISEDGSGVDFQARPGSCERAA